MSAGLSADPAVIPGAFYDPGTFTPLIEADRIIFQSPNLTKTYTTLTHGLKIEFDSKPPIAVRLPLAVDPWLRFSQKWSSRYIQETVGGQFSWGVPDQFNVKINASAPITVQTFNDSHLLIQQPENPNRDYPPANLLPFPLALVEIYPAGPFSIIITWSPNTDTIP